MTGPLITSVGNAFIKTARSLKTKKGREQQRAFLVEGAKCVGELMASLPEYLLSLIVTAGCFEQEAAQACAMGRNVYRVAPHVMEAVCDCKTPQGIAAIAAFPKQGALPGCGFIVALDDVQDPQNVGSIIRTADAAGCAGVVLSPGCADHFAPKAVRASMGSLFHLPVYVLPLEECAADLLRRGYAIACADVDGAEEYSLEAHNTCLVIGNESHGISRQMRALATLRIRIPMRGRAQSLSAAVAAGILIYKIGT